MAGGLQLLLGGLGTGPHGRRITGDDPGHEKGEGADPEQNQQGESQSFSDIFFHY